MKRNKKKLGSFFTGGNMGIVGLLGVYEPWLLLTKLILYFGLGLHDIQLFQPREEGKKDRRGKVRVCACVIDRLFDTSVLLVYFFIFTLCEQVGFEKLLVERMGHDNFGFFHVTSIAKQRE